MSVSNGQTANSTTFNNAFMSKTSNTGTTGVVALQNTSDPNSGALVTNTQRLVNEVRDTVGVTGEGDATRKNYSSNNKVANGDDHKVAIGKLDATYNTSTGHDHDGTDSKLIPSKNLSGVPLTGYPNRGTNLTGVTGTSTTVTTEMTGKTASGGSTTVGVVVTAPYNRVLLKNTVGAVPDDDFKSAVGDIVYGRITESAGVWTLSYYTDIAGTETAYSFGGSSAVTWWYQELYNPLNSDAPPPVYSEFFSIPTDNATESVREASSSQSGIVSTGSQNLAGDKSFVNSIATQRYDQATTATITALDTNGKGFIGFTGSTATALHGIANGTNGKWLILLNPTTADITIHHESGSATAANRINIVNATNATLKQYGIALLTYDPTASRWNLLSASGSGGGSGGASVRWYQPNTAAMEKEVLDNGLELFTATDLESTTIFAKFTVPETYLAGTQMFLKKGKAFSAATSGDFLLRATSYIFKANISGTSTPTGHSSTNTAQTIDATTNEIVVVSNIDLTDATGQINSVAVAAGDTILIRLQRLPADVSDTLADVLKILIDSFELDMTA